MRKNIKTLINLLLILLLFGCSQNISNESNFSKNVKLNIIFPNINKAYNNLTLILTWETLADSEPHLETFQNLNSSQNFQTSITWNTYKYNNVNFDCGEISALLKWSNGYYDFPLYAGKGVYCLSEGSNFTLYLRPLYENTTYFKHNILLTYDFINDTLNLTHLDLTNLPISFDNFPYIKYLGRYIDFPEYTFNIFLFRENFEKMLDNISSQLNYYVSSTTLNNTPDIYLKYYKSNYNNDISTLDPNKVVPFSYLNIYISKTHENLTSTDSLYLDFQKYLPIVFTRKLPLRQVYDVDSWPLGDYSYLTNRLFLSVYNLEEINRTLDKFFGKLNIYVPYELYTSGFYTISDIVNTINSTNFFNQTYNFTLNTTITPISFDNSVNFNLNYTLEDNQFFIYTTNNPYRPSVDLEVVLNKIRLLLVKYLETNINLNGNLYTVTMPYYSYIYPVINVTKYTNYFTFNITYSNFANKTYVILPYYVTSEDFSHELEAYFYKYINDTSISIAPSNFITINLSSIPQISSELLENGLAAFGMGNSIGYKIIHKPSNLVLSQGSISVFNPNISVKIPIPYVDPSNPGITEINYSNLVVYLQIPIPILYYYSVYNYTLYNGTSFEKLPIYLIIKKDLSSNKELSIDLAQYNNLTIKINCLNGKCILYDPNNQVEKIYILDTNPKTIITKKDSENKIYFNTHNGKNILIKLNYSDETYLSTKFDPMNY